MAKLTIRYTAQCDQNRSRTWSIVEKATGRTVREYLLNREEARYEALRMNVEAERTVLPVEG